MPRETDVRTPARPNRPRAEKVRTASQREAGRKTCGCGAQSSLSCFCFSNYWGLWMFCITGVIGLRLSLNVVWGKNEKFLLSSNNLRGPKIVSDLVTITLLKSRCFSNSKWRSYLQNLLLGYFTWFLLLNSHSLPTFNFTRTILQGKVTN